MQRALGLQTAFSLVLVWSEGRLSHDHYVTSRSIQHTAMMARIMSPSQRRMHPRYAPAVCTSGVGWPLPPHAEYCGRHDFSNRCCAL